MKKKLVSTSLVIALLAIAIVGGTLAYFTDTKTEENVFTVGNVEIDLKENNWVDGSIANPGVAVAKDPTVTNEGKNDAWVRVNVTLSNAKTFKTAMGRHGLTKLDGIFLEHDENKWSRASINMNEEEDTLEYSYYYKEVIKPKTSTGPLFESVKLPSQFNNDDVEGLEGGFTITVKADAIQADGLKTVEAAFEAFDGQK